MTADDTDAPPHETDGAADDVDYRAHPERYDSGRGEEGVFDVRPERARDDERYAEPETDHRGRREADESE